MQTTSLFIYTESSLHAGVGSTISVVDLPIQRERTTQFPTVQGSGIKGAIRSQVTDAGQADIDAVFGAIRQDENGQVYSYAGAAAFGDARIVLFPVRSLAGIFAFTTCPAVLARLARDVQGLPNVNLQVARPNVLVTTAQCDLVPDGADRIALEEFTFVAQPDMSVDSLANWLAEHAFPASDEYDYWRQKIRTSLAILPDNEFRDFTLTGTEIVTRVKLKNDNSKTVAEGQLWSQEALPSDGVLLSRVVVRNTRDGSNVSPTTVIEWLHNSQNIPPRIQLGGDETTGQGFVALRWY
jgi:CRISPR-associated protein Cmr4